jgi:hypothetical protein
MSAEDLGREKVVSLLLFSLKKKVCLNKVGRSQIEIILLGETLES